MWHNGWNLYSNVAITSGTIDGAVIGGSDPKDGTFDTIKSTDLSASLPVFTNASQELVTVAVSDLTNVVDDQLITDSTTYAARTNKLRAVVIGTGDAPTPTGYPEYTLYAKRES